MRIRSIYYGMMTDILPLDEQWSLSHWNKYCVTMETWKDELQLGSLWNFTEIFLLILWSKFHLLSGKNVIWPISFKYHSFSNYRMALHEALQEYIYRSSFRSDYRRWWRLSVKRNIRQFDYNYSLFVDL
jgi:hypothetical protein